MARDPGWRVESYSKDSGGKTSLIPALKGWSTFYNGYGISHRYFSSKREMLDSGYLEKGDIVWMYIGNGAYTSDFHHVGIYWGDGNSDVFWHSTSDKAHDLSGNVISPIYGLGSNLLYCAVKVGGIEYAEVEIIKQAPEADSADGDRYSFDGIRYMFYKDIADAQKDAYATVSTTPSYIGFIELDENGRGNNIDNGSRKTLRELKPGTYYVRESFTKSAAENSGFELDPTVYTVQVSDSTTLIIPPRQ